MRKNSYRENEIIEQTRQVIQSFYGRKTELTIAPMSEDFMWIGSNDFQWCEGIDEFIRVTKKEYQEEPVLLSDEEYHLLFHDRNVWVVYGRYKVTATLKDLSRIRLHIRVTFIWRMIKGNLRLAHVHGSASQDIPLEPFLQTESTFTEESDFFDFMEKLASAERNLQKLTIRDCEKNHRCLFPSEILYLKADGRHCIFYTKTGSFQAPGLLSAYEQKMPEYFFRIHKSYLVNCLYIDRISRYNAVLENGCELPISKERYMDFKRKLKEAAKPGS